MKMDMQHLGLQDLTASIRGQASHQPLQSGSTNSRINLCYADPAHAEVTRALYHDIPSKTIGHRPLEVQLKVLQVPPAPSDGADHVEQPPISPPHERGTPTWMAYYCTVQRILGHQADLDLNLAMRRAATACGLREKSHHQQQVATPHRDLRSWVKLPYGVTNGTYIQQSTPTTNRLNETPSTLRHD